MDPSYSRTKAAKPMEYNVHCGQCEIEKKRHFASQKLDLHIKFSHGCAFVYRFVWLCCKYGCTLTRIHKQNSAGPAAHVYQEIRPPLLHTLPLHRCALVCNSSSSSWEQKRWKIMREKKIIVYHSENQPNFSECIHTHTQTLSRTVKLKCKQSRRETDKKTCWCKKRALVECCVCNKLCLSAMTFCKIVKGCFCVSSLHCSVYSSILNTIFYMLETIENGPK